MDREFDVIVVGGGTAGFAAAVTAARKGANTLLIEELAYLGGTATGAQISMLMGFAAGEAEAPQRGVLKDVLDGLEAAGGTQGIQTIYLCGREDLDISVIPYESEILKDVIFELVEEAGVHLLLHTRVIGTQVENGVITGLLIHNLQGIQTVKGKIIVDASFHGSVAVNAGCRWASGDANGVLQPGTLMYKMAGVDMERYAQVSQPERKRLACKGIEEGCLYVDNLLARPLPSGTIYSNMSRINVNPLNTAQWSRAEMEARRQVRKISRFFIENIPGFENAHLISTGDFTGLRDSRRILGKYVLTQDDVLEGREFPAPVAKSSYPIDIHDADGVSSTIMKPKTGVFYVPYECLVTDEISNLLIAGRCISADYAAHACIRVMITCMRTGEAAGLAAAESAARNVAPNVLDGRIVSGQLGF